MSQNRHLEPPKIHEFGFGRTLEKFADLDVNLESVTTLRPIIGQCLIGASLAETVVFQLQFVFLCLQLEEGEIDVRFHSFKGCVLEKVQN